VTAYDIPIKYNYMCLSRKYLHDMQALYNLCKHVFIFTMINYDVPKPD